MFKHSRSCNIKRKNKFIRGGISFRREIVSVILLSLMIFSLLSLLSFSSTDNSLFYYSNANNAPLNWCGTVGAYAASLLLFLFGSVAFGAIFLISFLSILLLFRVSFKKQLGRIFAAVLLFLAVTLLLNIHGLDFTKSFPGGFVGFSLMKVFSFFLGRSGTLVLVYSLIWIGFVILLRVSFAEVLALGGGVLVSGAILFLEKMKIFLILLGNSIFKILFLLAGLLGIKRKKDKDRVEALEEIPATGMEEEFWGKIGKSCESEDLDDYKMDATLDEASKNYIFDDERFDQWRKYKIFAKGEGRQKLFGQTIFFLRNGVLTRNIFIFSRDENLKKKISDTSGSAENGSKKKDTNGGPSSVKYRLPNSTLFASYVKKENINDKTVEEECKEKAKKLEEKLLYFGVEGKVSAIRPGPVITLFEYTPAIGTKISKIISLEDDLAMVLKAMSIRIIAPIPGRSVIGFEISNQKRENVNLADILSSPSFTKAKSILPLILGVDIVGDVVVEDLSKMPHLLVAGSTGSGKSVALNTMLASLLCYLSPEKLKIMLIDPKHLEFATYKDIPHLLFPIITDLRTITAALKWAVSEMERRYEKMAKLGVRNLEDYHEKLKKLRKVQDASLLNDVENLPFIVIMVDELADLMMIAGKEVESCVTRLAQMARAAGIHLVVATQRPSVDVLTGLIKVNFPSRIAFRVSSKIDSKIILDSTGAEKLLGCGDMLYLAPRSSDLKRIHGAYISDDEIAELANYLRSQRKVDYLDLEEVVENVNKMGEGVFYDTLFDDVLKFVKSLDEVSISMLQRKYRVGFNRAARLIERLEMDGVIAPSQGGKTRKVLR